jgi:hypothetical protein
MTVPPPSDLPLKNFQTQERAWNPDRKCLIATKMPHDDNPMQIRKIAIKIKIVLKTNIDIGNLTAHPLGVP